MHTVMTGLPISRSMTPTKVYELNVPDTNLQKSVDHIRLPALYMDDEDDGVWTDRYVSDAQPVILQLTIYLKPFQVQTWELNRKQRIGSDIQHRIFIFYYAYLYKNVRTSMRPPSNTTVFKYMYSETLAHPLIPGSESSSCDCIRGS
ncbi:hypothetical protein GCM10025859_54660 [Alicyclobacillus fastidiosus]|nr:hypothetical protein GCM10025859_54660 [Alicyclobacillus fastidiosus]